MSDNKTISEVIKTECFHCGEECPDKSIAIGDKYFCCNGCKTVYEILEQNDMCDYYTLDEQPGITRKDNIKRNFDFLDDPDLRNSLIDFSDGKTTHVTFYIPQMHCSSCIWILENLYKLDNRILHSQVDFLKKLLVIKFDESKTSLKDVVILLDSIGYLPALNLEEKQKSKIEETTKKLYYKIGVAGFCFGNIMLLSFPEYLSIVDNVTDNIRLVFMYANLILALPVFFYSASEYYVSAIKGLRKKIFNIDVPITLGILTLFTRSAFEIFTQTGAGYFDSLSALVFFLLVGKLFQNKTYDALNFERNYKSYFPIAVAKKEGAIETTIPVEKIMLGDRLLIKNNEIIPADSVLISKTAQIDYSFVTGESKPVEKFNGDIIYAGGKQTGGSIEVEVVKEVSQSYLVQLWNNKAFDKEPKSKLNLITNVVSKYFTFVILLIAAAAFLFWAWGDLDKAFNAFTAVLIIACPCALALSTPFTLGNSLRIFGQNKFYLKSTEIIEQLSNVTSIVFDKTGTLTETAHTKIKFVGKELFDDDKAIISALVKNSSHPLSRQIYNHIKISEATKPDSYEEIPGQGITATVNGVRIKLGSKNFVRLEDDSDHSFDTRVYYTKNNELVGYFTFGNKYRDGMNSQMDELSKDHSLYLLSGDNEGEKTVLSNLINPKVEMYFNQSPFDKLEFINKLQRNNDTVMMVGDGLNDAGALKKSDVGITIAEDVNNFSPACDGILDAKSFNKLGDFIRFSRTSKKIIIASFIISFFYNIIGLSFAVQGILSPVIAAILMPISSISVVVFTTFTTNFLAKRRGLLYWKLFSS